MGDISKNISRSEGLTMKIMVVMGEYPPEEGERRRQAVL